MRCQQSTYRRLAAVMLLGCLFGTPAQAGGVTGSGVAFQPAQSQQAFDLKNRPGCRMMMGFMAGFNQMMALNQRPQPVWQPQYQAPAWPWVWQPVPIAPRVVRSKPQIDNGQG